MVWEFKGWVGKRPAQQPWFDLGYLNQALLFYKVKFQGCINCLATVKKEYISF